MAPVATDGLWELQGQWQPRRTYGFPFEMELFAFCLGADQQVRHTGDVVFFNQRQQFDRAIVLADEAHNGRACLTANLQRLPWPLVDVVLVVSLYDALARRQTFGQMPRAQVQFTHPHGQQLYNLVEDAAIAHTLLLGVIHRDPQAAPQEWQFIERFQAVDGGIVELCQRYGVAVETPAHSFPNG